MLVHVEAPEHLDIKATALRPRGHRVWSVFLSARDEDYWLAFLETDRVQPLHFDDEAADFYAKAALLFGEAWDTVWAETSETLIFQRAVLDDLSAATRKRIDNSSVDEVREWREAMVDVGEGEYLRSRLTGEDPLSLRN